MNSDCYDFTITINNFGRIFDDEWEIINPEHIEFWDKESNQLNQRKYELDGCIFTVSIDLKPLADHCKYNHTCMLTDDPDNTDCKAWLSKIQPVTTSAKVTITNSSMNSFANQNCATYFLEIFIYDFFIITNLSLPGVSNFGRLTIKNSSTNTLNTQPAPIELCSDDFDYWRVESLRGKWPTTFHLPLSKVIEWYTTINIGTKQKADTSIERAIFAIYHICSHCNEIESIIWIFHGLEAIYSTKIGENISGLVRRISILFKLDTQQAKLLNKNLRDMYNIRSSFVHGNYGIIHPLQNDILDPRLTDNKSNNVYILSSWGLGILISTIQTMIKLNITDLAYEEHLILKQDIHTQHIS